MSIAMCTVFGEMNSYMHLSEAGAGWGAWAHQGHRLWAAMPDEFWVYTYKVRRCPQMRSHDWTECPFAHKGERARRRDPRRFSYVAVSCPEFRASAAAGVYGGKGSPACARGLRCRYAHGVFELWLHPSRFRTRMCESGPYCPRRICFFAHFPADLRPDASGATVVPPPQVLRALPPPTPPSPPPPARVSRQVDWVLESMSKLRVSDASASATAAKTPAVTPAISPFPHGHGWVWEYKGRGGGTPSSSSRCSEGKEPTDASLCDCPHVDFIIDLVS